ncbi:hypothetical protein ACLOJK_026224 [Asimina triloba]
MHGCLLDRDGGVSLDDADVLPGIDDMSAAFEEDGGDGFTTEFLEIHPIEFNHKNRCSSMPLSNLKGTPIGDEGGEVRPAREKMLPSISIVTVRDGLRSRRIYDHVIIVNLLESSDHPSSVSLLVGSPEMKEMLLSLLGCCRRRLLVEG